MPSQLAAANTSRHASASMAAKPTSMMRIERFHLIATINMTRRSEWLAKRDEELKAGLQVALIRLLASD